MTGVENESNADSHTDEQVDPAEPTDGAAANGSEADEPREPTEQAGDAPGETSTPQLVEEDPELVELRETVDGLQARLRAVSSAYQQVQDEIASTRERLERNATLKEERRRGEVVAALFEPHQNLRRSIDAAEKGASLEDTIKGIKMVETQFHAALHKLGLEEVPGAGAPFDPKLHEALSLVPVKDPALDGVVIEVFEAGYRIGSTLIRPGRVLVGEYASEEDAVAEA